jgi:hypothetical protein
MCSDETLHNLQRVVESEANRQSPFGEPLAEGLAFEEFANDVGRPLVEANVIHGDDVGMIQRGGGAGLQFKAAEMIGVGAGSWPDQLQSDVAPMAPAPIFSMTR